MKGIRSLKSKVFNKPFEQVEIKIPYDQGMDEYSGLLNLFEQKGLLVKEGNRLSYTKMDGSIIKLFRKAWDRNDDGCLDTVMNEFHDQMYKRKTRDLAEQDITDDDSEHPSDSD